MPEPKVKSVRLKVETVIDDESTDGVGEELALLTKNLNELLKKIKCKGGGKSSLAQSKNSDTKRNDYQPQERHSNQKKIGRSGRPNRIKCSECGRIRHIQVECANTLKKKNNESLTISWSDIESEESTEEEETSNFMALTYMMDSTTNCVSIGVKDCAKKEGAEPE